MAATVKTFLKFALCLTLLSVAGCRVIIIEENVGDSSDVTVKIIIKHENRDAHSNLRHNKEHAHKEIAHPKDYISMDRKSYQHEMDGRNDLNNSANRRLLPDNLFEETSKYHQESRVSNQEPPEYIPELTSRTGINVGSCPKNYIRRGLLCLKNNS